MVFASPRMICEAMRRAKRRGWKDPRDRSVPGGYFRIKTNDGYYTKVWFRYDLPMTAGLYRRLHPEDLKKVRPQQIPEKRKKRVSKKK